MGLREAGEIQVRGGEVNTAASEQTFLVAAACSNSTSGGSVPGSRFLWMTSSLPRMGPLSSPTARTRMSGGQHSWKKLMRSISQAG